MTFKVEPKWLDKIVQPTELSKREDIPRVCVDRLGYITPQVQRFMDIIKFIEKGKWASAAHTMREWRANNPWIQKGEG